MLQYFCTCSHGGMVDAADSKSASGDRVPVQVRMGAPINNKEHYCSFFIAFLIESSIIEFANYFQIGGILWQEVIIVLNKKKNC